MSDEELLREFALSRSQEAFAELYRRHAGWIYGVARRRVIDAELAKDVTQAVFLLLAQKGDRVKARHLAPWLFTTTRLTARSALRNEARRRRHEREAAMARQLSPPKQDPWPMLAEHLDELVNDLRPSDRDAVLMHFYQRKTYEEVGVEMGLSKHAARKRIDRALAQLAGLFARRGVVLSALGIGEAIWHNAADSSATASAATVSDLLGQVAGHATARATQLTVSVKMSILTTKIAAGVLTVAIIGAGIGAGKQLLQAAPERSSPAARIAAPTSAPGGSGSVPTALARTVFDPEAQTRREPSPPKNVARTEPRDSKKGDVAVAKKDPDEVHIRGIVLDPDGKPKPGASVRAPNPLKSGYLAEASTDKDGRFNLSYRKSAASAWSRGELPAEYLWQEVKVAAAADGFGFAWAGWDQTDANGDIVLKLVADDIPIEGTLRDAQGKPASNIEVTVSQIESWITGEPTPPHPGNDMRGILFNGAAKTMGLPDSIRTDAMGRFTIKGLGRDRQIYLGIAGATVPSTELEVATRYMAPRIHSFDNPSTVEKHDFTTYGAKFEYQAHAAQTVVGTVRDAVTRQPLPGVKVKASHYAIAAQVIHSKHFLDTVTDQQGRFTLESFPAGKGNQILAVPTDDQPYLMRQMSVPEGKPNEAVTLDMDLHRGVWISGKVTEKGTGTPVSGRMMYAPYFSNKYLGSYPEFDEKMGWTGWDIARWSTRPDGSFRMVGIPGRGLVAIWHLGDRYRKGQGSELITEKNHWGIGPNAFNPLDNFGATTVLKEIDIPATAQEFHVDLQVDGGESISVTVLDDKGQPCNDCAVTGNTPQEFMVWRESGNEGRQKATFDVIGLGANESRRLIVRQDQRKLGLIANVGLADAVGGKLTMKLQPQAIVTGRVIDESGQPFAQLPIEANLYTNNYVSTVSSTQTDNDGRFELALLVGATYDVGARSSSLAKQVKGLAQNLSPTPSQQIDLGDTKLRRAK